jgi:hypothetical protein
MMSRKSDKIKKKTPSICVESELGGKRTMEGLKVTWDS